MKISAVLALSACGGGTSNGPDVQRVGMANPASVYCANIGGRLEMRMEEGGEAGYCNLPDGTVVEEWKLYRDSTTL